MHDYLTLRPVLIFCLLLNMAGESACGANPSAFRAGLARAKITPSQPGWLLAYDRHQKAEGVETDLWVRALAIQDPDGRRAVLVSADILGFPPSLSQEIHQQARLRHQLERGQILLAASHTHNGPVLPDRPSLEIYHDFSEQEAKSVHAYGRKLCEHVLDAIGTALADLQPAELSFSRGRATFGLNRRLSRNPDGPTDPEVPVLKIEGANGTLRAVVFGYACHGTTVMADTFFKYFGDYSGVAQEVLETQLPGTTALFLAGCGGDINPEPRGKVELAYVHGRTLATEVRSVLQKPDGWVRLTGRLSTAYRSIDLSLNMPPTRAVLEDMLSHQVARQRRFARQMLRQLDHEGHLPHSVPYPTVVWRLGRDLSIVGLSGEVCVDYALRLKRELGHKQTWVAGYTNEVSCYIPSERVLKEGGYEAGWRAEYGRAVAAPSMAIYGWPTPFAPGLEQKIVSTVHDLIAEP